MNKKFISLTIILSYITFGSLLLIEKNFQEIIKSNYNLILFIGLNISTIIGFFLIKKEVLQKKLFKSINPINFLIMSAFILLHIIIIRISGSLLSRFTLKTFTINFVIFLIVSLSEIAWIELVQKFLEEQKGFIKSVVAIGLFKSVLVIPLLFIKDFMILPQHYSFFAAYLVAISAISITLYKISKSYLISIFFSAIILAFSFSSGIHLSLKIFVIAMVEVMIMSSIKESNFS